MRSAFAVLLLAVQFLCADADFTLNITNNPTYLDTYLSPRGGHIGAGLSVALIDAAPDPRFYFKPFASNDSGPAYGNIVYNSSQGYEWYVALSPAHQTTSNVWLMWIGGSYATNWTIGADGAVGLLGGDPNGGWMACNVTDSEYGLFWAVNWFNGTGTPDNTECVDIGIAQG